MRTMRTIKSGCKEKEDYYVNDESLKKDEYYSEAEMESAEYKVTTAQWMGSKAASLGLTGDVEQGKFKQLFYGYLPGTSQRIRGDRKHGQENLAVDCTLSAPKSFSMHALNDLRLYEVHMEACRKVQAELDRRYGFQRKFIDGKQVNVLGDGLIVAAIPHWTSREEDMLLHTHLVIFNGVQGPDGKWRAFDDRQFSYAEWIGSFYRNELAKLTQQAGYEIREVALKDGGYSFEIEGISRSEIEHFSKRSMQIAEAAEAKGVSRNDVVLTTRKAKRISKTWQEFRDDLTQEMAQRGVELQTPSPHPVANPIGRTDAAAEIESAIRHLSERSVSFKREDLIKYALDHMQQFELSEVDIAINSHPELIQTPDGKRFTTAGALEREIHTIQAWQRGKGKAGAILNEVAALDALKSLEGVGLNQGQAEAIVGVLSATDQHTIIHGLAGVGKTTALAQLKRLIEANGANLTIRGYSPTIKAAKNLASEMRIETNTVEHLVLKPSTGAQNELWIIDEAGMASARQMETILTKANEVGARILLVGDTNQNHSIEAGSPMKSLMNCGVTTFNIHEIIRQKDQTQKRAVELASCGRGAEALSLLSEYGWVQEIEDCNARAQAAAKEWLSLSLEDRADTLIVTGTNAERLRITECLREGLREEGSLGEDHIFKQLVSRQLTNEQKSRAQNYSKGDYIRLNWQPKTTPLRKDKLYQVVGKKDGQLLVESEGGRLYWFDPSKYKGKEVFYAKDIALAVGDQLRWRITNNPQGQINGTEFTVKGIDGNRLAVTDEKGQEQFIDGSKPLGLDYALVWTAHGAQGLGKKRVIVSATSGPTSAKEPFYVKISRQKKHIVVFAENLKELRKWVSRSAAQDNPLELIGEDHDKQIASAEQPKAEPTSNADSGEANDRLNKLDSWFIEPNLKPTSFEHIGENYVRQNSSSESRERSTQGDAISESSRPDRKNVRGESIDSRVTDRGDSRLSREDPDWSRDAIEQAQGGREQDARGNWKPINVDRTTEPSSTRELGYPESPHRLTDGKQQEARQAVRERLIELTYRNRLANELSEPLARLMSTLEELRSVEKLNSTLQSQIAQQTELVMNQAKVEVLGTTLEQWRSLQQEPALALPELPDAIAPSDVAQLTNLIERFPAQKVIEFAMEDFYQATNLIIDTKSTQKLGSPIFRWENAMPTKTVEPPKKRRSTAPGQTTAPPPHKRTRTPVRSIPKPVKPESPFWVPDYTDVIRPDHIEPHHWQEMVKSAIHPDLIRDNVRSLEGESVYDRLLSDKLATMGTGQYVTVPMEREMRRYEQLTEGGWWGTAGVDAMSLVNLTLGQKPTQSDWGTFKGDNPRVDQDKTARKGEPQFIKYEHPAGVGRHLYFLNVSDALAQKIYAKHRIKPTELEKQGGFWSVVKAHPEIPINLGEGFKKTASATSQGDVQIGSSGVNGFYRARDAEGNKLPERVLNKELAVFAVPGQVFRFTFDQDTKASTIQAVRRDMVRTIELLEARGCVCLVAKWNPNQDKGIDDLIANQGPQAYARAIATAQTAEHQKQIHYRTEFNAIARQVRKTQPELSGEALDIEVYLRAVAKGEAKDGDRFVSQSDHARTLKDSARVQEYVERIRAMAPHYYQQLREQAAVQQAQAEVQTMAQQQVVNDRAAYEKLAQQVKNQLVDIPQQQFDAVVYKWAQAKGFDGDRILAQSEIVLSFKHQGERSGYVRNMKRLANRIDIAPGDDVSNTQRQLNERALKCGTWITQHYGKKQDDGWIIFEGNKFSYYAKGEEFKIYSSLEQRNVLELKNNRLVSHLSSKEVMSLESAVEAGKERIVKDYRMREAQEIKRVQSKKKGRGRSPSR